MAIDRIIKIIGTVLCFVIVLTVILVITSTESKDNIKETIAIPDESTGSSYSYDSETKLITENKEDSVNEESNPVIRNDTDENFGDIEDNNINSSSPFDKAMALADNAANSAGVDNEWAYWLINSKNPLPLNYSPSLTSIGSFNGDNRELDSRAADYTLLMMEAANNDGIILTLPSSYRRVETQRRNFVSEYDAALNRGLSHEEAFNYVASEIAVPNTSEHNAGLAIDFNLIDESFDQTAEFRWLKDNAHKFGFILRYPKGKTNITGIIYEPWHFRFIGLYHAEKIKSSGLTLEEYMGTGACANDTSVVEAFKAQLAE